MSMDHWRTSKTRLPPLETEAKNSSVVARGQTGGSLPRCTWPSGAQVTRASLHVFEVNKEQSKRHYLIAPIFKRQVCLNSNL